MGHKNKELTEDEIRGFLDELKELDLTPDLTEIAVADFTEADEFDRFKRLYYDERSSAKSGSWPLESTIPAPTKTATPAVTASEPSAIEPIPSEPEFLDSVPLRSTKRKAGRYAPNCFGSQFLHDPASDDCGPCKFSEGCKAAVVNEAPILQAWRDARRLHLSRGKPPAPDPSAKEATRKLLRGHYLAKHRRAHERRRRKDKAYQQEKRDNPGARKLIERECQDRGTALRDAIARGRKDKFLQQLHGREDKIVAVWEAEQLAILAHGGLKASAAQVEWPSAVALSASGAKIALNAQDDAIPPSRP